MPKSSKEQIIDDENKVISELKKNAKESIDGIGKNCKFSRQKVWRIIKRLEDNKTIWGYSSIVDDNNLGLKRYIILIKRTSKPITKDKIELITKRKFKKAANEIGVEVESSYFVHGSFDWVIVATTTNIKKIKQFVNQLYNYFSEGYVEDLQILETIFPVEINGISNPNVREIEDYFL
jgi:DNA-binding Lrp family transcriptional regulator